MFIDIFKYIVHRSLIQNNEWIEKICSILKEKYEKFVGDTQLDYEVE